MHTCNIYITLYTHIYVQYIYTYIYIIYIRIYIYIHIHTYRQYIDTYSIYIYTYICIYAYKYIKPYKAHGWAIPPPSFSPCSARPWNKLRSGPSPSGPLGVGGQLWGFLWNAVDFGIGIWVNYICIHIPHVSRHNLYVCMYSIYITIKS